MSKKAYFNDDLRDMPTAKFSIPEIIGKLRIFTGKSDRVITKIDKEMPYVEIAVKNILFEPDTKVLIFNSGIGALGVVFAAINQETEFFLYDSNIQNSRLSQKNLKVNYKYIRKASVINNEELVEKSLDAIIYDITSGYISLETITDNIGLAKRLLKKNGRFYCITHTQVGAKRHGDIIRNIFGNVVVIAKGKGGYRVFEAINQEKVLIDKQNKMEEIVEFSIFGKRFSLLTKAGVFSKGALDNGTRFLIENSPVFNFNRLLDFGCGWGAIGIVAASLNSRGKVILVDIDTKAVDVARENVRRCRLTDRVKVWATDDVRIIDEDFDLVLTNPPFHENTGNLIEMFKKVKKVMSSNGRIYMVVEKTYIEKFKQILKEVFGRYEIVNQNSDYFIIRA